MKCPFCGSVEDRVVDSRESREGEVVRRRRECASCLRRFTSYERVEEAPLVVVKSDGRREEFDRAKILRGLRRACEKRPVEAARLEALCDPGSLLQGHAAWHTLGAFASFGLWRYFRGPGA